MAKASDVPAVVSSGALAGIIWAFKKTWRQLLPAYWSAAGWAVGWACGRAEVAWTTGAAGIVVVAAVAACWPARSVLKRAWRAAIPVWLGTFAIVATATGPEAAWRHGFWLIFVPAAGGILLGLPWWWHQANGRPGPTATSPAAIEPEPATPGDPLTGRWAHRWATAVVGNGICRHTRLTCATIPRPDVIEATVELDPGPTPDQIMKEAPKVEVALKLNIGSVGWEPTANASRINLIVVNRSYIADPVPWAGPTYNEGVCDLSLYADGTPAQWTFMAPRIGVLNGLVVGSTRSGKSRGLGVLIRELLEGGWQVVVGDSQNGQSLPDWQDAVEYHAGVAAVERVLARYHAEVMARSELLASRRVTVFDPADPRVQELGLLPMMLLIDECHFVLTMSNPRIVALTEEIASTGGKAGAGIILATQLPQMTSLGGSIKIRDPLVAGNTLVCRLSNLGSGPVVLPAGFVGDPFNLARMVDGKSTAGMGYLPEGGARMGMLSRVWHMDERKQAAVCATPEFQRAHNLGPVRWLVPEVAAAAPSLNGAATVPGWSPEVWQAAFGVPDQPKQSTAQWVLARLAVSPHTAAGLLDRPDKPVEQSRLYEVLKKMAAAGQVVKQADNQYALPK
jgi:hypothetical protein